MFNVLHNLCFRNKNECNLKQDLKYTNLQYFTVKITHGQVSMSSKQKQINLEIIQYISEYKNSL